MPRAHVEWLLEENHVPKAMSSNPGTIYWMDNFDIICCKNCIVCLKRWKEMKKKPGLAHFFKKIVFCSVQWKALVGRTEEQNCWLVETNSFYQKSQSFYIRSIWLVDDDTRCWVLFIESNVIIPSNITNIWIQIIIRTLNLQSGLPKGLLYLLPQWPMLYSNYCCNVRRAYFIK